MAPIRFGFAPTARRRSHQAQPRQISDLIIEPSRSRQFLVSAKGMPTNLQEMFREGRLGLYAQLPEKYRPSMLDLLKLQGLGPKTIALLWSTFQVSDIRGWKLAREGKIRELPRMGEKQEQKLLKSIEDYRRIAGRFLLDVAEREASKIAEHLRGYPGEKKSLQRARCGGGVKQ